MNKDEDLQKYMVLIEQYKEQMNQLEVQTQYLQAVITDYNKAKLTLEQISKADTGTDMLLPIGGSTYIDATVKNTSKVLYDIGGGYITEKTNEDAIKNIDKRLNEFQKTHDKLMEMIQKIQKEATEVYTKAQNILADQQK